MKAYNLRSPKAGRRPVTLPDLIAREHARVVKLTNQLEGLRRKLASARLRYSTFNRMALDAERRAIMLPGLPTGGTRGESFEFEPAPAGKMDATRRALLTVKSRRARRGKKG